MLVDVVFAPNETPTGMFPLPLPIECMLEITLMRIRSHRCDVRTMPSQVKSDAEDEIGRYARFFERWTACLRVSGRHRLRMRSPHIARHHSDVMGTDGTHVARCIALTPLTAVSR